MLETTQTRYIWFIFYDVDVKDLTEKLHPQIKQKNKKLVLLSDPIHKSF